MARDKDDDGSGFTGKRNKSWREIDAKRGKGSKYTSRQDDPAQQRIERSATYERYKHAADALFTGGELPDELAKSFDPDGKRKAQKEAQMKLRELDRKGWVQGVIEYLEKYPELPDDPFFLDSLLDHPRERIVGQALGRLELLEESGRMPKEKTPKSLDERLKAIEITGTDPELQGRAKTLRTKIRAR